MYGLTYEQRKRAVFEFLYRKDGGLLRRYRAPEHLSDDAMRDEVNLLVEDINQLIPNEQTESDLRLLFAQINTAIRRRHGAQSWPPAKIFIATTEDAVVEAAKKKTASVPAGTSSLDPYEIISAKMRAGEPVPEGYLWGREAVQLIARGLIDQTTMEGYRTGAFMARKDQYGAQAAIGWEDGAKLRHRSAKNTYHQRKDDGRAIDPEILRRLQADLDAVAGAMDRRSDALRWSA
jgi:hypothetical protein